MGTTINGIYIPNVGETVWDVQMNAGLTLLANAHVTSRKLFLPAAGGVNATGTIQPSNLGTFPSVISVHQLQNGLATGVFWTFKLPSDAATAAFVVRPIWAASANDGTAHTVRWIMDVRNIVPNAASDVTLTGATTAWTGDSVSRTINVMNLESGQSTVTTFPADSYMRLNLQRDGAHANDTFTATACLIGVQIDYQNL